VTQVASAAEASPSEARTPDYVRLLSSPWVLPLVLLITFAVFAPTLHNWFWADDFWLMRLSQTTPIGKFIVRAFDYRDTKPLHFYRPLYFISFRLSYAAFGRHALPYHALNLAIHLGSVVLVWVIARRLLASVFAANVASLIFALHPAYTQTVQWIARGNTVMVTFVYLLTLLAFIKYVDGGGRRLLYYAASIVSFAAAVLYHTTALSLIGVLPAYLFLIARKPSEALRLRSWLRFAPFIAIAVVMMLIQMRDDVGLKRLGFETGWHQYPRFGQYLGYALFPVLPADWLRLDLPKQALLTDLSMAGSLVMIGATLVLLDRRQWPYRGVFTAWWLYVAMAPNTTWILDANPAYLYVPGACLGIFFALVARRVNEMLPADLLRRASSLALLFLAGLLVCYIALGLNHEQIGSEAMGKNRSFISRLRESVPPLTAGSTLYIVDPPHNLMVFNSDTLNAAVQLYYGDVTVQPVSAQEAARIKKTDPNQVIFDNRP
jgi:hypothetical protein